MSDPQEQSFSNNPYAPKIPHNIYFREKADFFGVVIGSILYGVVIVLFFKCVAALFNPVYRGGERIKWELVSHIIVMFLFVTAGSAMELDIYSISRIDNREYPGVEGVIPPGPFGYRSFISSKALVIVPGVTVFLNNWLGDGLLLYRCYVIYSMNRWVVAFPSLMYLASVAMGITLTFRTSQPNNTFWNAAAVNFGLPYFSISIALNVLLTLMIVIRLILHTRKIRNAVGIAGTGGLCKAIITMHVESCAIYTVNQLLFVVTWAAGNVAADIFLPILGQTQVIAPLLIIQRVANKSALTSNSVVSGRINESKIGGQGTLTSGSGAPPGEGPMSSVDERGLNASEFGAGAETTVDFH